MNIPTGKKIYFASDQHLGVPDYDKSLIRERHFIKWLEMAEKDAAEIFLVGDLFDFWFEYKTAVPKGFVRVLGKIANLTDKGIPVTFFTGNHDMWAFDYLEKECGVKIYRKPIKRTYNDKIFFIGHGDGLGPGDYGYKFIKKVFANKLCQWAFARLHPNLGIGLANYFSKSSRAQNATSDKQFLGEENEWLAIFAKEVLQDEHIDFFVFGHRHFPMDLTISKSSRYINLGDWVTDFTYGVFDGQNLSLEKFGTPKQQ